MTAGSQQSQFIPEKSITKASHEVPRPSNFRVMILHTSETGMVLPCLDYIYIYVRETFLYYLTAEDSFWISFNLEL